MQFIFLHRYSWYTFCRVFSLLVNLDLKNDKDNVKAHSGDGVTMSMTYWERITNLMMRVV